jgi:LuxR family maltose regulon positive regulatory protein
MSSAPKLVTMIPGTEEAGLKGREVPSFVASVLSRWDDRDAQSSSSVDTLTAREREVLAMISQGSSNKHIARVLEISPETVKSHVKHIFLKLAVSTRTEAVFRALSLGLL